MQFEYKTLAVKDLVARTEDRKGRTVVTSIEVDGQPTRPSGRFWASLFSRFGFNGSVFKFFNYMELLAWRTACTSSPRSSRTSAPAA